LLASPFGGASETFTQGRQVAPMPRQFKTGDYVWYPQISPAGPVVIVVSIPEQQLFGFVRLSGCLPFFLLVRS
jgi:hypothetical protein